MIYNIPESNHYKVDCQSCLCMMCENFFKSCRWCFFCYALEKMCCKFCRDFVPAGAPERIRRIYTEFDENPEKVYNREDKKD